MKLSAKTRAALNKWLPLLKTGWKGSREHARRQREAQPELRRRAGMVSTGVLGTSLAVALQRRRAGRTVGVAAEQRGLPTGSWVLDARRERDSGHGHDWRTFK